MLRKLLKYEIKSTARIFLLLYLVLLASALINKLVYSLFPFQIQTPKVISMIVYITILVGMFVITISTILKRFYKNLLTEEGYLMFTLPTQPWKLITSKLLVAILWIAASSIAAYISIFIIVLERGSIRALAAAIRHVALSLYSFLGPSIFLFIIEILLGGFMGLATLILLVYASIALGHLCNRHRILASVGAFIALNTFTQIFFFQAVQFFTAPLTQNMQRLLTLAENYLDVLSGAQILHGVMWFCIAFTSVLAAGYFALTNYVLSNRLNLE